MANRTFLAKQLYLVKRPVELWVTVAVGAAGAVTLQKRQYSAGGASVLSSSSALVAAPTSGTTGYALGNGQGCLSVVRTGTGAWTITLSDAYQYLFGLQIAGVTNATGVYNYVVGVKTTGTNVNPANTALGSGGTVAVVFSTAGTATDPTSGDVVTLQIDLGDETEP